MNLLEHITYKSLMNPLEHLVYKSAIGLGVLSILEGYKIEDDLTIGLGIIGILAGGIAHVVDYSHSRMIMINRRRNNNES